MNNDSNADDLARFVNSEHLRGGDGGVGSPQQEAATPDLSAARSTLTGTSPATGVRMQVRSAMRHDVRGQDKRVAASVEVAVDSTPPSSRPDSVGRAATARPTAGAVVETAQRVRFPSSNPLFAGCPALFLQTACGPSTLGAAASLVAAEETGILLTLDSRTTALAKALRKAVGECRAIVAAAAQDPRAGHAILVDANRYSGKNRAVATAAGSNLDPAWIEVQRELGLPVALTDSPYIESADHAALGSLLAEARALGQDVVAVLPLHLDWLKKDASSLVSAVNRAGAPVALVLEHADDPLGVQDAVAGLVHLLKHAEVAVALLRCDISVIGAIAFGASLGAVGTTTGLRHLYPAKEHSSGFNGGARIGTYVPRGMVYRALETLNTAISLDQEHQERWICGCGRCYNRPLSHITDEVAAYEHALTAIADLGESILNAPSALHRQHAWVGECNHAQITNLEIADDTGLRWEPPKFQAAWHKLSASLPPLP